MRRELYGVGSFLHIVKRGARGITFLKDAQDRDRLLLQMRHFNDINVSPHWYRDLVDENKITTFERSSAWGEEVPLTRLHSFCLHGNHFHILSEEIVENGVSHYMKKLGVGISAYLNERHQEHGSPFQGSYRSKTIDTDAYLRYAIAYIEVKNTFEQFPGGYQEAVNDFDAAYSWALAFPYSSLHDHLGRSDLPERGIVSDSLFSSLWNPEEFKDYARDVVFGRAHLVPPDNRAFLGNFL